MALKEPLVHCLMDVEPAPFHASDANKPIAFAVNLSLECRSDSGSATPVGDEEKEARLVFEKVLQAAQKVRFHVWKFTVSTGFELVGKVDDQVSESTYGVASDLLAWLDEQKPPASTPPTRYWSTRGTAKVDDEVEVTVEAAGAADRLRAAQSWNAPIAHKFALTHVVRPENKNLDHYVVLPYFADPGASPDKPTTTNTVADHTWDVSYDPLGGFGKVTCRTDLLKKGTLPLDLGTVDSILTPEGFLKVDPDAANLRRITRWFEDRAAALLAAGPALASRSTASKDYEPLFEPTFAGVAEKPVINAPVAAWAAAGGLCAMLDNLVIGILKPASGKDTEGQILSPLVTALLAELDAAAIRETHNLNPENLRAPIVTDALRDVIRQSPLGRRTSDRAQLAAALRHVHGIGKPGPDAAIEAKYIEALLRFYDGKSELTVDPALPVAVPKHGLAIMMRALADAEQRLQDEAGAEAAALRLIETSAPAFNGPPARLIAEEYARAINRPGDDALKTAIEQQVVPRAWAAYRAVLEGAFNGAEAVRRAASSEFLKMVLAQVTGTTSSSSEEFRTLVKGADYFAKRLFGDDANPPQLGCFGTLIEAVPTPEFLGKPDEKKIIREHLVPAYTASVEVLDRLFDSTSRFIPDGAPQPLSIQIAANIDGAKVDKFARYLNGIAVGLRRIDSADDSKNRWAHANLADLTWAAPEKPEKDKTVEGAIHPMLPAVSDGRAPMFIEYEGFPFASTELLNTRLPDSGAMGPRAYRPFYRHGSSQAPKFARVPRLAYGRAFQSFAFVTTNAGTLPHKLQDQKKLPWLPHEKLEPPEEAVEGELIATAPYSRRTAIGQTAVEEVRDRRTSPRIGAPIASVAPLASDYPRIGLFATGTTGGARDLFRESDGRGALVIGSVTAPTITNSWQLADIRWTGAPKAISLRFFDGPAAEPGKPGAANFTFAQKTTGPDALDLTKVGVIGISVTATRTDAADPTSPLDVELSVTCAGSTPPPQSFRTRSDTLWLRLELLSAGPSAGMTFADVGAHKPDGVDAPLLLLAPADDKRWSSGLGTVTARVHTPRIGYLDFDRWLANGDLRRRIFDNDDAARRFEEALLAAYVMRHLDAELAAALDRLPDPAAGQLRLELIVLDQLTGTSATPKSATFDVSLLLRKIAETLTDEIAWDPDRLKSKIFKEIEKQFCCTIAIGPGASADLAGTGNGFTAKVPAGHVARLSIDTLVPADHFDKQGSHPPVFDRGLLQYATRSVEGNRVGFPSAAIRIETMLGFTDAQKKDAIQLAADMIFAQPIERSRRYDIVTRERLPGGASLTDRTNFWRLIGEIDVTSQRWRPSGRPIYHHIAPRDYRADGMDRSAEVQPALQLLDKHGQLNQFENEAFFNRSNLDAQTITQKLLPLPSRTVLQQHLWDAPSAIYFRHRFTLRSRYAGALRTDRELNAWAADQSKPVTAWTMRVAMFADMSRILLTRPQLRALIPLTTAPGADTPKRVAPPVLGVLQEPPFARGGLADRVDAEIKTGFGYGFEADNKPVEILSSRKEIGPTPYLDYRPMNETVALGMTLVPEGPVGLTFDPVNASGPAFPNSLVTLSPLGVGDVTPNGRPLEEHFLGVSLRRHIDPEWTTQQPAERVDEIDAERCWWIDVELQSGMGDKLLQYKAAGVAADLLLLSDATDAFVVRTLKLAVDGYVEGSVKHDVDIARLERTFSAKLSILHQPIAPGRYSVSVFAIPNSDWAKTDSGQSNAPLMLASFEWSPPSKGEKKEKPVTVTLMAHKNATVRETMASAPTFLAWTRTSRDFDFVQVAELKRPIGSTDPKVLANEPARITQLVAMLTSDHEKILLKRSGSSGNPAWLTSSTFLSEYPLHVHRHLAVLTTRYLDEPGRPIETFCRSAVLAGATTELTPRKADGTKEYPAEDCVRVVEFETPAAILCGAATDSTGIPHTYRQAYFDLIATGFKPERTEGAFRLLVRLVGSAVHLRKFKSLEIGLANVGNPERRIEVQLDNTADDFTKALELRVEAKGWSVVQLRSDGGAIPVKTTILSDKPFKIAEPSDKDPGFFMTIKAKGGAGEFWADVSLLHAPKTLSSAFDFNWLFAGTGGNEPAIEVTPQALRQMAEVQARIVTVSPPIPIVSHNESPP
jgi:hypothetical protein